MTSRPERQDAHTPGPWRADGPYVFHGRDCIAITDTDNASPRRMAANARLIAAAPGLLDALREIDTILEELAVALALVGVDL